MVSGDLCKDIINKNTKFLLYFSFSIFFVFISNVVVAYNNKNWGSAQSSLINLNNIDLTERYGCSVHSAECDRRKIKDHCINLLPVSDQKKTNCCWAFAFSNHFSISNCLINNVPRLYSGYELAGCSLKIDSNEGGNLSKTINTLVEMKHWTFHESFPDKLGCDNSLHNELKVSTIYGFVHKFEKGKSYEEHIMTMKYLIVNLGSVIGAVRVENEKLPLMSNCFNKPLLHAVTIVGWTNENGMDYWIYLNSWGEYFGEKGFGKIPMIPYNCPRGVYTVFDIYFLIADFNGPQSPFGFPPKFPFKIQSYVGTDYLLYENIGDPTPIKIELKHNDSKTEGNARVKRNASFYTDETSFKNVKPHRIANQNTKERSETKHEVNVEPQKTDGIKRRDVIYDKGYNNSNSAICEPFDNSSIEPDTKTLCKNIKSRLDETNTQLCIKICEARLEYCTIHPEEFKACLKRFMSKIECVLDFLIAPINRVTNNHYGKAVC